MKKLAAPIKYHFHIENTFTGHQKDTITILFLHGWMGSAKDWRPITADLLNQYHTISVDLPGHGDTKEATGRKRRSNRKGDSHFIDKNFNPAYFPKNIAKGLSLWIESQDLKKIILVGYSMGGRIALLLAPLLGDRLRGLVLESAGFGISNKKMRKKRLARDKVTLTRLMNWPYRIFLNRWYQNPIFGCIQNHPKYDSFINQKIRQIKKHTDLKPFALSLVCTGNGYMPHVLKKLPSVPVLYLTGEKDRKYSTIAEKLREETNVTHCEVSGCGHNIHFEKPADFLRLIKEFIQSLI